MSKTDGSGRRVKGPRAPFGKGVIYHVRDKVYQAYITEDGVKKHLGYFDKEKDALAARAQAVKEWHSRH
jgi:hypothetical protein